MSLKAFHVFFITLATLLALGFGLWALESEAYRGLGVLGLTGGVSLATYGWWFLKKMKHVGYL